MSSKRIASPEPLSLPHFDEEATLLSARPVVPLHEVRAETRSKRRLILVSTIVAGFVFGALGASMLFMPGDKQTNSVAEGEQGLAVNPVSDSFQHNQSGLLSDSAGQSPNGRSPSGQAVNSSQTSALTALTKDPTSASAPTSRTPNLNRRQGPRTSSAARPTRANPAPNNSVETLPATQSDVQDLEIDQGRLRREERREDRRLRRARQNTREQSSDDLMRINEIFEGTPRP